MNALPDLSSGYKRGLKRYIRMIEKNTYQTPDKVTKIRDRFHLIDAEIEELATRKVNLIIVQELKSA